MDRHVSRRALAAAAVAMLVAQPALAATGCWTRQQAAAAKVRDLQSRLMVAALRCKAMGYDVVTAYNDFIRRNRDALQTTNGLIRARFVTGYGKEADLYYDRFATSLANLYGGDATSGEICDQLSASAQEGAAAAGDFGKLLEIADRFGPTPELPGGECPSGYVPAPTQAPAPAPAPVRAAPESFAAAMDQALSTALDPASGDDDPPPPDRPN